VEKIRKQLEETVETLRKHDVEHSSVKEELVAENTKRHKLKHLLKQEREKYERLESVPEANAQKVTECESLKETLMAQAEEEQEKYDQAVASLNAETQVRWNTCLLCARVFHIHGRVPATVVRLSLLERFYSTELYCNSFSANMGEQK
jgi:hypothetical protein